MSENSAVAEKWNAFRDKVSPVTHKIESVFGFIFKWMFRLRKIVMAAPVAWFAVQFALDNAQRLPEMVGFNLQSNGQYAMLISRNYAVWGTVGVTAFCLLLMFCSRKTVFPWVVSIFTLVLPYLIWIVNLFPA